MLSQRDKAIINDLNKFRVMDRDSIAEIHFKSLKNPITAANSVLLRLLRDGHIQRSTSFQPFVYFGPESQIKKNSAKIGHFLAILDVYKEMRKQGRLESFLVEPKYGSKGVAEPDIFAVYRNTPFFIEVQKIVYSEKQMNEKLSRYVDLYSSGLIQTDPLPHVLILSNERYAVDNDYPFRIFQSTSFIEFMQSLKQQVRPIKRTEKNGIIIKIGS